MSLAGTTVSQASSLPPPSQLQPQAKCLCFSLSCLLQFLGTSEDTGLQQMPHKKVS